MIKVIVFGTFDIIHKGHLDFFKQAKNKGDFLTVVVARNKNVVKIKGRNPLYCEKIRLKHVKSTKLVDKAMLGDLKDPYKCLKKEKPNIICLGYDQSSFKIDQAILKRLGLKCKIIKLKPYKKHIYKSSKIKRALSLVK